MLSFDFLERANCDAIETFIMTGGESVHTAEPIPLEERLREAEKEITKILFLKCETEQEREEVLDAVCGFFSSIESIYFEAGMLAGAKLAFEIGEKMRNLYNLKQKK